MQAKIITTENEIIIVCGYIEMGEEETNTKDRFVLESIEVTDNPLKRLFNKSSIEDYINQYLNGSEWLELYPTEYESELLYIWNKGTTINDLLNEFLTSFIDAYQLEISKNLNENFINHFWKTR